MRHNLFCCLVCWTLCLSPVFGELPFKEGEKLTYHFYWGFFMVGRGTFQIERDSKGENYRFTVRVKSNDFISILFPVDDVIASFFDIRSQRSVRFLQDRKEGDHHYWEETFFFYNLGCGQTQSYVTGEKKWFEIPKDAVQDKLSTIYYMRLQDWNNKAEHSVLIGNDKRNYEVKIRKLKKEAVELDDFAPIRTFKVEPNTEYLRGFTKNGKIWAWISDDSFKIPVRVVAELSIGTVSCDLVAVDGIDAWLYQKKK